MSGLPKRKRRVFVVEDNPDLIDAYQAGLPTIGLEIVETAVNGEEAAVVRAEGTLEFRNEAMRERFGGGPEGHDFWETLEDGVSNALRPGFERCLETQEPFQEELRIGENHCDAAFAPLHPRLVLISLKDISLRVRHRTEAAETRGWLSTVLESVGDAVIATDARGAVRWMNSVSEALTGWRFAEAVGRPLTEVFNAVQADDRRPMKSPVPKILNGSAATGPKNHTLLLSRTGERRSVFHLHSPLRDANGSVSGALLVFQDVTERDRIESDLRESETRFDLACRGANDGLWDWNLKTGEVYFSPRWKSQLGHEVHEIGVSPEEWSGRLHPEDRDRAVAEAWRYINGETDRYEIEFRMRRKDGAYADILARGFGVRGADGRAERFVGTHVDLTDLKRTERKLQASEGRFRAAFEQAAMGMAHVGADGRIVSANRRLLEILGTSAEALLGRPLWKIAHPDDGARGFEAMRPLVAGESAARSMEVRLLGAGGGDVWVNLTASAVRDGAGAVGSFIVIVEDISERKRNEAERTLLSTAIDHASESVMITDLHADIQYVNPAFTKTTGYSKAEAVGRNPHFLSAGRQDRKFYGVLWETIANGEVWEGRFINRKKDGALIYEDASISPVRDASGAVVNYVAMKRDVTREVTLESQWLHAQKMEAIGTLAGGVAHDFNNMLAVIQGNAELMADALEPRHPVLEMAKEIIETSQRAASLTRQLLAFSRQYVMEPRIMDLNESIAGVDKMLRRVIGKDIALTAAPHAEPCLIFADPGLIDQVLLNLAVNARDAMPDGGTLMVSTAIESSGPQDRTEAGTPAGGGDRVRLTVGDNGVGMDRSVRERIFEPFFTTKEPEKGTGLGLSTVHGIVLQSGGEIDCASEPGLGATFTIRFPLSKEPPLFLKDDPDARPPTVKCGPILVVDDEPAIRKLVATSLSKLGYSTIKAADAREAVGIAESRRGELGLLISDMEMPDMNGVELARRIREKDPGLRVLFMSGHPKGALSKFPAIQSGDLILQKPFTIRKLTEKTRDALEGKAERREE